MNDSLTRRQQLSPVDPRRVGRPAVVRHMRYATEEGECGRWLEEGIGCALVPPLCASGMAKARMDTFDV